MGRGRRARRAAEEERKYARSLAEKELRLHQELTAILGGDAAPLRQMSENEKKEQLLREETARLRGRLDTLGDPLVWKTRLRELEAEHERVEFELEALTAALDELALADEEMRSEFSPALAKSAASVLSPADRRSVYGAHARPRAECACPLRWGTGAP